MRKQIAAANWKMNLRFEQAIDLVNELSDGIPLLPNHQEVILGVPFPYLLTIAERSNLLNRVSVAAQNCSDKPGGAYTGEISAEMLESIGISYVIVGHSERREYFQETGIVIAEKNNQLLRHHLRPIFCCGEPLQVREADKQNEYVAAQLEASLYHLDEEQFSQVVIAYEPIWAIGTGKTATAVQADEMHSYIRYSIKQKFGSALAENCSILYGGSVKGNNAHEIFSMPNVDGGLVGGASLKSAEFLQVIAGLKK